MFIKTPENQTVSQDEKKTGFFQIFRHQQLLWGVVAQFFYVGAQVGVTSFFIRFTYFTAQIPEKSAAFWLGWAMFGFMLGRFVGTFLTRFVPAPRLLTYYALINMLLLAFAITNNSHIAVGAVFLVPFFMSIMFPTIFALAINNLKEDTEVGSSLLVMSIVGGAIFPLLMGWISDQSSIQMAYIVPLICFGVVAVFGSKVSLQTSKGDSVH